ncbi:hypothetical protein DYB32_005317 [Aphanomyces invadans]|uniref:serine--tRNA ligase n=1 Tax=Aphanomyces invadans TaxID=157072 RepID=A0A418AUW4_9STRA|nr:hypothetical protein DYB32_005317 [Aphanomyces invadans]
MLGRVCRRSFSTPIKSRLDFKALSANLDDAIKNVAVRKSGGDPARVASLYTKLGSATNKVYRLRQERNLLSKQSGDIERGRALKAELTDLEASLETLTHELVRMNAPLLSFLSASLCRNSDLNPTDTVLHTTKDLPKKVAAFGHCFRTEVGHGGKDTKGLYRIHQFSKVEMFAYCTLEDAEKLMDELLAVQVEMVSELGLHCQVVDMATEDLGAPAYRKWDILAWMPGRQSFNEISSLSNCTDYQARRLNIRHKIEDKKPQFVATLNGTALAVPRILISILETYQEADGSVRVPAVLRPYIMQDHICKPQSPAASTRHHHHKTEI